MKRSSDDPICCVQTSPHRWRVTFADTVGVEGRGRTRSAAIANFHTKLRRYLEREFPSWLPRYERLYTNKYPPDSYRNEVKAMVRFGLHVVGFAVTYTLARAVDRIGLAAVIGQWRTRGHGRAQRSHDPDGGGGESDAGAPRVVAIE